jgi:hypothetical protein
VGHLLARQRSIRRAPPAPRVLPLIATLIFVTQALP